MSNPGDEPPQTALDGMESHGDAAHLRAHGMRVDGLLDHASAQIRDPIAHRARQTLEFRRMRASLLPPEFFGEPAWDMLLDLFVADREAKRISISSACIASGVAATTALRWLSRLEALDMVERSSDANDRRRIFVNITPRARQAINDWLVRIME